MKTTFLPFVLLFLLLSGCATKYQVRLDGLSDQDYAIRPGSSYELISETPGVENGDLFFKEVAGQVDVILKDLGYTPVAEGNSADTVIGINAHLSEPMVETHSYSESIYANSRGFGYSVAVPVVNKQGQVVRFVNRYYSSGPSMYYAGSIERDKQYTVFDKVLQMSARPYSELEEIWNLKVSLRDQSSDYRSALPYMLVAAKSYIGKRTEGQEIVAVSKDSPEVAELLSQLQDE